MNKTKREQHSPQREHGTLNTISELPEREHYWDLEPSQHGPHHPNWRGNAYRRLTLKVRLAKPNGIEQGGVTGRSPQHTRTLNGSLSDDQ